MNHKYLEDKILGCLSMAAIGDALGMPAHDMTIDEIAERFGGPIRDFHPAQPDSRVHPGYGAAEITDDTLLTLATAKAYIIGQGRIDSETTARLTAEAFEQAKAAGRDRMFGPSTRRAVEALASGQDPVAAALSDQHPAGGASNGAAMKISPVGLVNAGNVEGAVADAITVSLPSHPAVAGAAAAAAVAAGVAVAATPGADVYTVVQACLAGAVKGEKLAGVRGRLTPLPLVSERIRLAIELVLTAADPVMANRRLADVIGTGLAAYESVPTAIGIFLANAGQPDKCVTAGANVGFDTDTIACMAGSLAGALHGFEGVPRPWYDRVTTVNGLDLEGVARELAVAIERRAGR